MTPDTRFEEFVIRLLLHGHRIIKRDSYTHRGWEGCRVDPVLEYDKDGWSVRYENTNVYPNKSFTAPKRLGFGDTTPARLLETLTLFGFTIFSQLSHPDSMTAVTYGKQTYARIVRKV